MPTRKIIIFIYLILKIDSSGIFCPSSSIKLKNIQRASRLCDRSRKYMINSRRVTLIPESQIKNVEYSRLMSQLGLASKNKILRVSSPIV